MTLIYHAFVSRVNKKCQAQNFLPKNFRLQVYFVKFKDLTAGPIGFSVNHGISTVIVGSLAELILPYLKDGEFLLDVGRTEHEARLRADGVLLATGRFLGGGFRPPLSNTSR